jgi:hypothetical protein
MNKENIENNKPENIKINTKIVFYEDEPEPNTFGSNTIMYELYYERNDGILTVLETGAFGDSTLVARFQDRRGRGITLKEMLENIEEISNMTYKEFKEKVLKKGSTENK